MAFFNNLFDRVSSGRDAPALQKQVLPQVMPVKQLTGIGSMLPMQTITLPGGQTVQIPQLNMNEINANLLASGITPQTPLPQDMGALDKFEKGGNRMFDGGAYDKYQIILGETEARAVQARRGETIATPNVKNRFSDSETFEKTYFPPDQFKEGKMVKPPSFFGLSLDDLIS